MTLPRPAFASATQSAYLGPMLTLPRPVSPRNALADLKLMFSRDRPHRWGLLGVSAALTGIILWGFYLDSRSPKREREIIYVESWMSDRRDSDIIRQQKIDLANYEVALEKRQARYQELADTVGIDWRKDAEQNRTQRLAVIAAVQKQLDKRLADALAREAASGKPPAGQSAESGTTAKTR